MRLFFIIIFLSFFSVHIYAQGTIFEMDPARPFHHGSFTFSHPNFDMDDIITTFSGSYNLNLNLKVSESGIVHLGLPINYLKYDSYAGDDSRSGAGNLNIGYQNIGPETNGGYSSVQLFVFFPTVDNDAAAVGLASDFTDFMYSFPDIYAVAIQYAAYSRFQQNLGLNYFIGGNLIIPTEDSLLEDPELFFRLAVEPVVVVSNFYFFVTFKTVVIITQDVDDFADRFQSFLGVGTSVDLGSYQPKLAYRIYLDEPAKDIIDGVFIIGLDFNLGD